MTTVKKDSLLISLACFKLVLLIFTNTEQNELLKLTACLHHVHVFTW